MPKKPEIEAPSMLDEHKEQIIQMKLAGVSDRQIADSLGVSNSAVSRYVKRQSIRSAMDSAHGALVKRAQHQMATALGLATQTLIHYASMENFETIPHQHRLKATELLINASGASRSTDMSALISVSVTEIAAESARSKAAAIEATLADTMPDELPSLRLAE
jgi:transcriptional regulator with XRE-family HTH domain